jgi:hypothetical protein
VAAACAGGAAGELKEAAAGLARPQNRAGADGFRHQKGRRRSPPTGSTPGSSGGDGGDDAGELRPDLKLYDDLELPVGLLLLLLLLP